MTKEVKQEQDEPVCDKDPRGCWSISCQLDKKCKNTPQTKEWVGLTNEQIVDLVIKNAGFPTKLAKEIEDKLKDKNT